MSVCAVRPAHHWLVASLPAVAGYPARCRHCGAQRHFPRIFDLSAAAIPGPPLNPPPFDTSPDLADDLDTPDLDTPDLDALDLDALDALDGPDLDTPSLQAWAADLQACLRPHHAPVRRAQPQP